MPTTVKVYADIGDSWWGDGISAKQFSEMLEAVPVGELQVDVRINSYGGLTSDGLAMMNFMFDWSQKRRAMNESFKIVAHVDGYAYSAASILPLSADEIVMHPGSLMMIHNAWMHASGDHRAMADAAAYLEKSSAGLAKLYAKKTGQSAEKMAKLMDAESFFTPVEAVALKLADRHDEIDAPGEAKALYANLPSRPSLSQSYSQWMTAAYYKRRAQNHQLPPTHNMKEEAKKLEEQIARMVESGIAA